jgi:hypothetical protein
MFDLWDNPPISSRETLHGFQDRGDIVFSAVPAALTVYEWPAAILSALPTTGQNGGEPELATMHLPVSHFRALHSPVSMPTCFYGKTRPPGQCSTFLMLPDLSPPAPN